MTDFTTLPSEEYRQLIVIARYANSIVEHLSENVDPSIEEYALISGAREALIDYDPEGTKLK